MKNTVIHIPHDGSNFPPELLKNVIISREEFENYHKQISDRFVSKLVDNLDYKVVKFPVSRMLCDVERFLENEVMQEFGMGFCYEKTFDGKVFKTVNDKVKEQTKQYYFAHHKIFDEIAKTFENKSWNIIDLHSFHKSIIVRGLTDKELPDICIGYEKDFCDKNLLKSTIKHFENSGYSVALNYPYEGSFVPNIVYSGSLETNLNSVMIEINKTCYLDESFEIKPEKFNTLKKVIEDGLKKYRNRL